MQQLVRYSHINVSRRSLADLGLFSTIYSFRSLTKLTGYPAWKGCWSVSYGKSTAARTLAERLCHSGTRETKRRLQSVRLAATSRAVNCTSAKFTFALAATQLKI